jgi:hypothetical protein
MKWYYYLHTNGDLIGKNPVAYSAEDFGGSDFVKAFWLIDTENRADLWKVILEALAQGARIDRIKDLCEKWGATKIDAFEMMARTRGPVDLQKTGLKIFIVNILCITEDVFYDDFKKWAEKK